MKWRGRRQSSNVRDHRGSSSRGGGLFNGGSSSRMGRGMGRGMGRLRFPRSRRGRGGLSITSILILLGISWLMGINPLTFLLNGDAGMSDFNHQSSQTNQSQTTSVQSGQNDELTQFIKVVLADTEDIWAQKFSDAGRTYQIPTLNIFANTVRSACGMASSATGPFYCPADQDIYIDLAFYRELKRKFEAPGDFAQAYVIAHEVGHHVQNLTGVLPAFNQKRRSMSKSQENAMSIRVELQADCYAGIWAHETKNAGYLETGDLNEALNAATQIGDDALQRRLQGYIVPESFNHGTSAQRRKWFEIGYKSGHIRDCDTFSIANP